MGGGSSINYAVAVTKPKEGETAIYRNPDSRERLLECPSEQLKTVKDILINSGKRFADKNALGKLVLIQALLFGKKAPNRM